MKLTYDKRYNIAYIQIKEKEKEVETVHVSDQLNVDLAPDGTIYGIELLNANEQLQDSQGDTLQVIDEATGKQVEVSLGLA